MNIINTAAELAALPEGTRIREAGGDLQMTKGANGSWGATGRPFSSEMLAASSGWLLHPAPDALDLLRGELLTEPLSMTAVQAMFLIGFEPEDRAAANEVFLKTVAAHDADVWHEGFYAAIDAPHTEWSSAWDAIENPYRIEAGL